MLRPPYLEGLLMTPSMLALQRRNLSVLLQSLATLTQARAAELAGLDASAVSRMQLPKETRGDDSRSDLERFTALLAACNLKLVSCTTVSVDPDQLQAMRILARAQLEGAAESNFGELT